MWRQYSINPRVITRKLLTKSPIWRITKICFYLRLPLLSMRNQLALSSHQCEPLKKCCLSDTLTWLPKTSEINLELQFDKFVISEDRSRGSCCLGHCLAGAPGLGSVYRFGVGVEDSVWWQRLPSAQLQSCTTIFVGSVLSNLTISPKRSMLPPALLILQMRMLRLRGVKQLP